MTDFVVRGGGGGSGGDRSDSFSGVRRWSSPDVIDDHRSTGGSWSDANANNDGGGGGGGGGGGEKNRRPSSSSRRRTAILPDRAVSRGGVLEDNDDGGDRLGGRGGTRHRRGDCDDAVGDRRRHLSRDRDYDDDGRTTRRAAKRRVRHDLPGPVGSWFRSRRRHGAAAATTISTTSSMAAAEAKSNNNNNATSTLSSTKADGEVVRDGSRRGVDDGSAGRGERRPAVVASSSSIAEAGSSSSSSPPSKKAIAEGDGIVVNVVVVDADSPEQQPSAGTGGGKRPRQSTAFHDQHASDLHECNAWNMMCTALDRNVPRFAELSSSRGVGGGGGSGKRRMSCETYGDVLRRNVADDYALVHEIHEGRYDIVNRCDGGDGGGGGGGASSSSSLVDGGELTLPLLVGYVAHVHCHAHSDWTVVLVDEMHGYGISSVGDDDNDNNETDDDGGGGIVGGGRGGGGGGVVCWIEESLVKKHPNWVRPGCVWMMEGARLALFASDALSCDEHDDEKGEHPLIAAGTGTDVSPSTENARGGGNIDRMILVGEYCLVYAWTPEEATSGYVHDEYVKLTERRANLDLPFEAKKEGGVIELIDEGDEEIGGDDDGVPMGICVAGVPNALSRDSLASFKAARDDVIDGSCLGVKLRWSKGSDAIIANDAESDKSTLPPPAATNDALGSTPFEKRTTEGGGGTTAGVDLLGRSKMIEEERKRPSTTIAADFGGPHREQAAQAKTTAVSLLTRHEYDDVNDESMPHEKILEIEEESPAVPSNHLAATRRTEREGKMRHAEDAGDDVGKLHIAPTRERNADGHPAGRANDNTPRPVSCETAASSPHHNIVDDSCCRRQQGETINATEVGNSNPNAPSRPRRADTFDADILDEETTGMAPCSTPKGPNEEQCYSRLRIDTGDSFDDMLDEDDDVSPRARVGTKDHRTQEENARVHLSHDLASRTDSPHVARSDVTDTPPNYLALPAATRAAFLFDTLDGDDLDFLGEDE